MLDVCGEAFNHCGPVRGPTATPHRRRLEIDDRSIFPPDACRGVSRTSGSAAALTGFMMPCAPAAQPLDQPLGDGKQRVLGLADVGQPFEGLIRAATRPATDDADRLVDHRSAVQRAAPRVRSCAWPATARCTPTPPRAWRIGIPTARVLGERRGFGIGID